MDAYLDLLDSYQERTDIQLSMLHEYMTERVGDIGKIFERSLLILDQFILNCRAIVDKNSKRKKVAQIMSYWEIIYPKLTPKEQKEMISFRDYPELQATDADYMFKMIRNIDAAFRLHQRGKRSQFDALCEELRNEYLMDVSKTTYASRGEDRKHDSLYRCDLGYLYHKCKTQMETFDKEIKEMKANLFSMKSLLEQTDGKALKDLSLFKFFKNLNAAIKQKSICMMYNWETLTHAFSDSTMKYVSEEDLKRIKNYQKLEKSTKKFYEFIKQAKFVEDITFGDTTFHIYQLPVKHVSCLNIKGTDIYIDESFYEYSRPVQRAILYHEIGHYVAGHFGLQTVPDEVARIKQIKRDMRNFSYLVAQGQFVHKCDELIYLLVELEADRFAASQVGKISIKLGLWNRAKEFLQYGIAKDPNNVTKDEKLLIAYNMERMQIRTNMI